MRKLIMSCLLLHLQLLLILIPSICLNNFLLDILCNFCKVLLLLLHRPTFVDSKVLHNLIGWAIKFILFILSLYDISLTIYLITQQICVWIWSVGILLFAIAFVTHSYCSQRWRLIQIFEWGKFAFIV